MTPTGYVPKLHAYLAALPDSRDARSDNERADYHARYTTGQRLIDTFVNKPADLERVNLRLGIVVAERDAWLSKERELVEQVENFTDWRLAGDGRQRDQEYERQYQVKRALQHLHAGTLLKAPDVSFGQLEAFDARIAELTERRDLYQRSLDDALAQAERLLGETVSS